MTKTNRPVRRVGPIRLDRRALLRGAGVAVALPTLEAMTDGRGRWFLGQAQAAPPVRMVTFFFPNGWGAYTKLDNGARGDEGPNLNAMMADGGVLAPVKADLLVLRKLYKRENSDATKTPGCAHDSGHGSFATGVGTIQTGAGGPSIDQVAAARLGAATRFPSLSLAIGRASRPWTGYASWKGAEKPVPPDNDPVKVWEKLFKAGGAGTPGFRDYRRSMLDHLKGEVTRLQSALGAPDKATLEEHLTGLREVERAVMLEAAAPASCNTPSPAATTESLSNERAQLLMQLLVIAMRCDLTRFASFMLANRWDNRQFPWLGVGEIGGPNNGTYEKGHHALSHDGTPKGAELQRLIVADQVAQFVYLMKAMKAVTEPGGTLLGNSILFCTSEHQNGAHQADEVPVLLAGQAGGRLRTGRDVSFERKAVPYANALATVLDLSGVPTTKFGTHGTGLLPM